MPNKDTVYEVAQKFLTEVDYYETVRGLYYSDNDYSDEELDEFIAKLKDSEEKMTVLVHQITNMPMDMARKLVALKLNETKELVARIKK